MATVLLPSLLATQAEGVVARRGGGWLRHPRPRESASALSGFARSTLRLRRPRDSGGSSYFTVVGIGPSLPAAIWRAMARTFATSAFGTFELIGPRPTPLLPRSNTAFVPPWNLPAS